MEKLRFVKERNRIAEEREEELIRVKGELAYKGLLSSGNAIVKIGRTHLNAVERMVSRRIEVRQELIRSEPALASPSQLEVVKTEIDQLLEGAVKNDSMRHLSADIERIRLQARRDLEILRLEFETGISPVGTERPVTINISNSTVGALNLGGVIGDIQVSVQKLREGGSDQLASAIKEFAEAVAREEAFGDARKDVIESLSTISEQAVKPHERRALATVKAVMSAIRESVATADSLRKMWETFEPLVKGYFWASG